MKESKTKNILESVKDFEKQRGAIASFTRSLSKSAKFKTELVKEAAKLLEFRLQSASLLYLCLELHESEPSEYIYNHKMKRDPYLLKMVNDANASAPRNKPAFEHVPNLAQLKEKLTETDILPLDDLGADKIKRFWDNIHQKSHHDFTENVIADLSSELGN